MSTWHQYRIGFLIGIVPGVIHPSVISLFRSNRVPLHPHNDSLAGKNNRSGGQDVQEKITKLPLAVVRSRRRGGLVDLSEIGRSWRASDQTSTNRIWKQKMSYGGFGFFLALCTSSAMVPYIELVRIYISDNSSHVFLFHSRFCNLKDQGHDVVRISHLLRSASLSGCVNLS